MGGYFRKHENCMDVNSITTYICSTSPKYKAETTDICALKLQNKKQKKSKDSVCSLVNGTIYSDQFGNQILQAYCKT